MLKIRLSLKGKKKQRSFWIVVIDARKKRDSGSYLARLGFYNPHTKESRIEMDKVEKWLSYGAKPTDIVQNLLNKATRK